MVCVDLCGQLQRLVIWQWQLFPYASLYSQPELAVVGKGLNRFPGPFVPKLSVVQGLPVGCGNLLPGNVYPSGTEGLGYFAPTFAQGKSCDCVDAIMVLRGIGQRTAVRDKVVAAISEPHRKQALHNIGCAIGNIKTEIQNVILVNW